MSDHDFPTMMDGRRAPRQPTVKCWNLLLDDLPRKYHWLKDDIKVSGYSLDWLIESTGEHLGGFSGASARKGPLTVLLDDATDPVPLPGHVVSITKGAITGWYRVEETSEPMEGKAQVTLTLTLTRMVNPFFTGLLSADEGDTFRLELSLATMDPVTTIATNPVNHRDGSVKAYSLEPLGETTAFPGITIDPATGEISVAVATAVAGVYELDVLATDTLTNKRTLKGGCRLVVTITA